MKGRAMDTPKEEAETKECGQRMRQGQPGFPCLSQPPGARRPSGRFPEPRQAERVLEPDSRVPLGVGEIGHALFALVSGCLRGENGSLKVSYGDAEI